MKKPFCILHIPHASLAIPAHVRPTLLLTDEELSHELLRLTDRYTEELFDCSSVAPIVFPVSRLVVDPERFHDDNQEPMSAHGMGLIYTKTTDGALLRNPTSSASRQLLINEFYAPHHKALTLAVESALIDWGSCLIIDCHSFPSKPFPYEKFSMLERPDLCLGTDPYHTPEWLYDHALTIFNAAGFNVSRNEPFQGTLVPSSYYQQDKRVMSIMIEINRKLYIDEATGDKLSSFPLIRSQLSSVLHQLITVTQATRS